MPCTNENEDFPVQFLKNITNCFKCICKVSYLLNLNCLIVLMLFKYIIRILSWMFFCEFFFWNQWIVCFRMICTFCIWMTMNGISSSFFKHIFLVVKNNTQKKTFLFALRQNVRFISLLAPLLIIYRVYVQNHTYYTSISLYLWILWM